MIQPNHTNYHCHSVYCDGRADMHSFLRFAVSEGFSSFGFSSHAPLPFPTNWTMEWDSMEDYLSEFARLKQLYEGQLELIVGLEIDYLDEKSNPSCIRFRRLPLDFRIGSVHMLRDKNDKLVDIDCSPEKFHNIIDNHFDGDLDYVIHLYYDHLIKMVELGGFDILGHADKMHYNAACYRPGLLDEPWYDRLVKDYFDVVAESGCQVEINTKSYLDNGTFYPNERYFEYLHSIGVKVQVNSDSHYPERINNGRPEAFLALLKAGYTDVMEWHGGEWVETPISYPFH
jgi:histidinol-phosphatase (PHP family)